MWRRATLYTFFLFLPTKGLCQLNRVSFTEERITQTTLYEENNKCHRIIALIWWDRIYLIDSLSSLQRKNLFTFLQLAFQAKKVHFGQALWIPNDVHWKEDWPLEFQDWIERLNSKHVLRRILPDDPLFSSLLTNFTSDLKKKVLIISNSQSLKCLEKHGFQWPLTLESS